MTASAPARRQRIRPVAAGLERLAAVAPGVQPRIQKAFWKAVYSRSTRRAAGTTDVFMNYGYAPLANGAGADLDALGTALYDRVAQAVPLTGKDVLEVGCGRGGGTVHVS